MNTYQVKVEDQPQALKFDSDLDDLRPGEHVIVELETGADWGTVATTGVKKRSSAKNLAQILRRATEKDEKQIALLLKSGTYAQTKAVEEIAKLKLNMKIISAHYSFDAGKILILFTADQRVDFRVLVRNLAGLLHARIELRQVGARDEVKAMGALGSCGQECCCCRFCQRYPDVSIKMAKQQNIALNPDKINGVCGRLKCCLSYEYKE